MKCGHAGLRLNSNPRRAHPVDSLVGAPTRACTAICFGRGRFIAGGWPGTQKPPEGRRPPPQGIVGTEGPGGGVGKSRTQSGEPPVAWSHHIALAPTVCEHVVLDGRASLHGPCHDTAGLPPRLVTWVINGAGVRSVSQASTAGDPSASAPAAHCLWAGVAGGAWDEPSALGFGRPHQQPGFSCSGRDVL